MSYKNSQLLQEIINRLKLLREDDLFLKNSKNSNSWTQIIKYYFEIRNFDGRKLRNIQNNINDKNSIENTLKESLSKNLGFAIDKWESGITAQEIDNLLNNYFQNFKKNPSKNPDGRPVGVGGAESCLLGEIVEKIINTNITKVSSWRSTIQLIAPNIDYASIEKSVSGWKKKYEQGECVGIRNIDLKESIAKTLNFEMKSWGDIYSIDIDKLVDTFLTNYNKENSFSIDFKLLDRYIYNKRLTQDEKVILNKLKKASKLQSINRIIANTTTQKTLRAKIPSETFLIEATKSLYNKGAYFILTEFIFPQYPPNLIKNSDIAYIMAHTYASTQVADYDKAYLILKSIKITNRKKQVDIQTSLVSNFLRHSVLTLDLKKDKPKLIKVLENSLQQYNLLFNKSFHYYPAINLAYILMVYKNISEDNNKKFLTIEEIYEKSKNSLELEKSTKDSFSKYYATITELEFNALLGYALSKEEIELMLNNTTPTADMKTRSYSKIIFIKNILESFNKTLPSEFTSLALSLKI